MAVCPVCSGEGELCKECPKCHKHYVEAADLRKSQYDELLGDLIGGQYVPLALIGEGGMGKIYRAKAKYTGQVIALKVLKSDYMEDETLKDRFFREAEVVAALDHPHIVKLYSCAPDPAHNTIFMAMELLKGRTLFDVLSKDVPDVNTMLRFFLEIADALSEAHKKGVFHRDLKPENVFIVKDDNGVEHVKVLDFGFARLQGAAKKLTMAGVAFGTPHYMSPEQCMGMIDITAAVDVYAYGVMLFQAISGSVPYDSATGSPMEVMHAQVYDPIPPCKPREGYHVSKRLIECVYKCMSKEPKDRYPDCSAVYADLVDISKDNAEVSAEYDRKTMISNEVVEPPAQKSITGSKQIIILAIVFGLLLAAAVVLVLYLFS